MNICLVGEAWGREEEEAGGQPFVGWAGRLLNQLLSQVGINRRGCFVTNVFNLRPKPSNDITNLCGSKVQGIPGMPALVRGKFVRMEFKSELDRLYNELKQLQPNLTVALGGTAAWALLRVSGIKKIRGTTIQSSVTGGKVLCTYHPAALARDWSLRPIILADFAKCAQEQSFPEVRRPRREVWIEPSLADLEEFERQYIVPSPNLSIDIETVGRQITCIGFAPSPDQALVVPFFDLSQPDRSYWRSHNEEVRAWKWVKHICGLKKRIVGQNFLYDMNHLWTNYGITVPYATEDTMLLHHALFPELEKGLSFLGSVYSAEASWKINRENSTAKKED